MDAPPTVIVGAGESGDARRAAEIANALRWSVGPPCSMSVTTGRMPR